MRVEKVLFAVGALAFASAGLAADVGVGEVDAGWTGVAATLDEVVAEQMSERGIPGLALAVVAAGRPVIVKGYGHADVASGTPVDPNRSLFPLGSVAKPVTWTAVMQLEERGLIALPDPVSAHLPPDIGLPSEPWRPITIADLMAHAAGFEDRVAGIFTRDPASALGPTDWLLERGLPRQIDPPGAITNYCNDCVVLAAALVEHVTGRRFADYAREEVLEPLGMADSAFESASAPLPGDPVTTYYSGGADPTPSEPTATNQIGAGGLHATAADMAKLMLAYLGGGSNGRGRILDESTVRRMLSGQFRMHPDLPGMSYGWFEATMEGRRVLFHSGDTLSASSFVALVPEADVGIFVAYNVQTNAPRYAVVERLMEHLAAELARFEGTYGGTRIAHSEIAKLNALANIRRIVPTGDGYLSMGDRRYARLGALLFVSVDDPDDRIGFAETDDGSISHLFVGERPNQAWQRLAWWQQPVLHASVLVAGLLALVSGLVVWIVGLVRRRGDGRLAKMARVAGASMSVGLLGTVLAIGIWLATGNPAEIAFGNPPLVVVARVFSVVLAAGALASAAAAVLLWTRRPLRVALAAHVTAVTVAAGLVVALFAYWRVLPLG